MLKNLCVILVVPVLVSIFLFFYLRNSLPRSITLRSNTGSSISIERDVYGIPHVSADSLKDAYYGVGYSLCQDRMWQIDMIRRISTGRVSEILGIKALDLDKFIRNLKLHKLAKLDVDSLPAKTREICESFIKGINDAAVSNWLPIEYYLTNSKWQNYTLADSQSYLYLTALVLSNIWGSDVLKVQLRKTFGDLADVLIPANQDLVDLIKPSAFTVNNEELADELKGPKEMLKMSNFEGFEGFYSQIFDEGTGSNAWVISGEHTKSGKPILCNDPHLSTSIPTVWYLNHIVVGNYSEYGGQMAGYPAHSIGRNNKFSWGATSLKVDDIDVYAIKEINSTHYLFDGRALEFQIFEENFEVKGEATLNLKFRETVHGPVIENSIAGLKKLTPGFSGVPNNVLALSWASHYSRDQTMNLVRIFYENDDIEEVRKEIYKSVNSIRLNYIAASVNGDILYQVTGKLPIKQYQGDSVLPGWVNDTMWKGFVTPEEMPYSLNPKKGFIVTANNFIANDEYKYFESLGTYFLQARAERITEVIQGFINKGHKFTPEDQKIILSDDLDLHAKKSIPALLKRVNHNSPHYSVANQMKNWDFLMSKNSKFAAIYAKWFVQLAKNLLKDRVSDELIEYFLRNQVMQNVLYLYFTDLNDKISVLCDSPKTEKIETCDDFITKSFEEAVEFVGDKTWGELHQIDYKFFPFSEVPFLHWIYGRKIQSGGWMNTAHAAFTNWNSTFDVVIGQGVKLICDMGQNPNNYWSLETGNSGNVFSRNYDDLVGKIHYGEMIKFNE